jgi:hypothetical protein
MISRRGLPAEMSLTKEFMEKSEKAAGRWCIPIDKPRLNT